MKKSRLYLLLTIIGIIILNTIFWSLLIYISLAWGSLFHWNILQQTTFSVVVSWIFAIIGYQTIIDEWIGPKLRSMLKKHHNDVNEK